MSLRSPADVEPLRMPSVPRADGFPAGGAAWHERLRVRGAQSVPGPRLAGDAPLSRQAASPICCGSGPPAV